MGLIVFSFALLGILSRPINYASALWPANPVLAGLMARHPMLAKQPLAWIGALLGFLGADLLTGSGLLSTLWFTAANLGGAWVCSTILLRADTNSRNLQSQHSALLLFGAALTGALAAAAIGSGTGPVLFQSELWPSAAMWVGGELMGYILILPVLLTFPRRHPEHWYEWLVGEGHQLAWRHALPIISLGITLAAALIISGPGTLSFVVPSLLWCALSFTPLITITLCLVTCLILTVEVAMGSFQFTPQYWMSALSLRIGITLLALGPIAVACNRTARKRAIAQLDYTINHDFLTGLLSRSAFFRRAHSLLKTPAQQTASFAVLALDLDHFKQVNDKFGHAVGDDVLRQFAHVVSSRLRQQDLFGRLGGEEFLIMLPHATPVQAQALGHSIVNAVRIHPFLVRGVEIPLKVTVSVGVAYCKQGQTVKVLDHLIQKADTLLYQAKQQGRNQTVAGEYLASVDTDFLASTLHRRHAADSY